MPNAAPRRRSVAPDRPDGRRSRRPPPRRTSWPSASRPRRRRAGELVQPQRPAHPQPERTPPAVLQLAAVVEVVQARRPLRVAGDHEADAQARRPGRALAPGRAPPSLAGDVGEHARRGRAPRRGGGAPARRRARRPARQPRVARLAEPAEGHPGQPLALVGDEARAGTPDGAVTTRAALERGQRQRLARAEAQGRVELVDPRSGRLRGRSATDQATRCTRVAPRRVSRPAYISASSSAAAVVGQRPLLPEQPARAPGR